MTSAPLSGPIYTDGEKAMSDISYVFCNCTGDCKRPGGSCPCSNQPALGCMPFGLGYGDLAPPIPFGHSTVGTCSLCRGPVTVPMVWSGIIPPTPTCASCGAVKKSAYGPTIEMEKSKDQITLRTTVGTTTR